MDGDDDAVFGIAQFTETDVLSGSFSQENSGDDSADVGGASSEMDISIRDLVANGQLIKQNSAPDGLNLATVVMEQVMGAGDAERMEIAAVRARKEGDQEALIRALECKVKQLVRFVTVYATLA